MSTLKRVGSLLDKSLMLISRRVGDVGVTVLMVMMMLTVVDITLRRVFNSPLPFGFELVEVMLVIVAFCSIAYTTSIGRHVSIDVLTMKFPAKAQAVIVIVTDFFSAVIFGLATWRAVIHAMRFLGSGYETGILKIPLYPFVFVVALGCALACLLLLAKVVKSINGEGSK